MYIRVAKTVKDRNTVFRGVTDLTASVAFADSLCYGLFGLQVCRVVLRGERGEAFRRWPTWRRGVQGSVVLMRAGPPCLSEERWAVQWSVDWRGAPDPCLQSDQRERWVKLLIGTNHDSRSKGMAVMLDRSCV